MKNLRFSKFRLFEFLVVGILKLVVQDIEEEADGLLFFVVISFGYNNDKNNNGIIKHN